MPVQAADPMATSEKGRPQQCPVRYDPPSLGSFHFPYGTALLNKRDVSGSEVHRSGKAATFMVPRFEDRLALLDEPPGPVPKRGCHHCDRMFFSPIMMERLVCAVLKQLSEKLDSVRERAGTVLESIVHGQNPRLPFVPRREAIVDIMEGFDDDPAVEAGAGSGAGRRAAGSVNWASPAATFPMVVVLLAIPEYHDAIVSGLVVSVGGLSESVVKQSSSALLRWVKVCKSSGNKRALVTLGNCLVSTFGRAAGEARVVLPLLKTIEVLLSNDSFDFLYTEEHPLPESLRAAIVLELKGCRDVTKLCLGASVLVCMLDFGDPARSKALRNSVMLVAHRFPNVRKAAAEALYLKLLAAEELVSLDAQEEVLDILSSTPWDNDLDTAKAARSKLGKLLSVEVPQVTKPLAGEDASRASSASAGAKKDEMESYESLVRTAGY